MLIRVPPLCGGEGADAMPGDEPSDGAGGDVPGDGRAPLPRRAAPAPWNGILAPVRRLQQRADLDDYNFLVGSVIDGDALERAGCDARCCGVTTHEALLAMGLAPGDLCRGAGAPSRRSVGGMGGGARSQDCRGRRSYRGWRSPRRHRRPALPGAVRREQAAGRAGPPGRRHCSCAASEWRWPPGVASTLRLRRIGGRSGWISRCAASTAGGRSIPPAA